jgi:hypothetical protein
LPLVPRARQRRRAGKLPALRKRLWRRDRR